jgi:hypothetical protein
MVSSLQRPLSDDTQHLLQGNIHDHGGNVNPQSQQESGRRPTPFFHAFNETGCKNMNQFYSCGINLTASQSVPEIHSREYRGRFVQFISPYIAQNKNPQYASTGCANVKLTN